MKGGLLFLLDLLAAAAKVGASSSISIKALEMQTPDWKGKGQLTGPPTRGKVWLYRVLHCRLKMGAALLMLLSLPVRRNALYK